MILTFILEMYNFTELPGTNVKNFRVVSTPNLLFQEPIFNGCLKETGIW